MEIYDLRSCIAFLEELSGEIIRIRREVDPKYELCGITKKMDGGPAILFEKVKGHATKVMTGLVCNRNRVAKLLGTTETDLPLKFLNAIKNPIKPKPVATGPCKEVIVEEKNIDLLKMFPIPLQTEKDAGHCITAGIATAKDPETGERNISYHRMVVKGRNKLSFDIHPLTGRHIEVFYRKAEAKNEPLAASVSIGVDPGVMFGGATFGALVPLGYDEYGLAGGLLGRPIELVKCETVDAEAPAYAEIVLEGEILPKVREREDSLSNTGYVIPELSGYYGTPLRTQIFHVTGVTHREKPIYYNIVVPSVEHTCLTGCPAEASLYETVKNVAPHQLKTVYMPPYGGGKLSAVIQLKKKTDAFDEGVQRNVIAAALTASKDIKVVIVVDEDVNIFDPSDVLWALVFRSQPDHDIIVIPGARGHVLDPTSAEGITAKVGFDATAPFKGKERFIRPQFAEVNLNKFLERTEVD
jgi:UbiD family decarboxylase